MISRQSCKRIIRGWRSQECMRRRFARSHLRRMVRVGLGAPKQEEWMYAHRGKLCAVAVGVGAGFDYLAGHIKRAPRFMQRLCLEWLYRLLQDPRRLWKRYVTTNAKFVWYLPKERRRTKKGSKAKRDKV